MNDNQEASDCVNTIVLFVNTGLRVFSETLMEQVLWTTFPFNVPPPLVDPRELGRQGRKAVADPGFPRLTNPNGRGAPQPIIWSNFLNLTEMYQAILYFFRNSLLKPLTKRNG